MDLKDPIPGLPQGPAQEFGPQGTAEDYDAETDEGVEEQMSMQPGQLMNGQPAMPPVQYYPVPYMQPVYYYLPGTPYATAPYPVMYYPPPGYPQEQQQYGYTQAELPETFDGTENGTQTPTYQQQQQHQQEGNGVGAGPCLNANQLAVQSRRLRREREDLYYKTEICRTHQRTGHCPYGSRCQFAHGLDDLRPRMFDTRFKTEYCDNYHKAGNCPFGSRCKFIHDDYWEKGPNGEFLLVSPTENVVRIEQPGSRARYKQLEELARGRVTSEDPYYDESLPMFRRRRIPRSHRAIWTLPRLANDGKTATTSNGSASTGNAAESAKDSSGQTVATGPTAPASGAAAPPLEHNASEFPPLPSKPVDAAATPSNAAPPGGPSPAKRPSIMAGKHVQESKSTAVESKMPVETKSSA